MRTIAKLDVRQVLMVRPAARTKLFKYKSSSRWRCRAINCIWIFFCNLKTECDFHQLQERVMNINFVAIFLPWNSNYHVFLNWTDYKLKFGDTSVVDVFREIHQRVLTSIILKVLWWKFETLYLSPNSNNEGNRSQSKKIFLLFQVQGWQFLNHHGFRINLIP